jgi:hypothetical protein
VGCTKRRRLHAGFNGHGAAGGFAVAEQLGHEVPEQAARQVDEEHCGLEAKPRVQNRVFHLTGKVRPQGNTKKVKKARGALVLTSES